MLTKIQLNDNETLRLDSSSTKGPLQETDINYYSILNEKGDVVGTAIHEDHTSIKGFQQTQHITQKDMNGNVIVQVSW